MRRQDLGWVSDGDPAERDRGARDKRIQVRESIADAHIGQAIRRITNPRNRPREQLTQEYVSGKFS